MPTYRVLFAKQDFHFAAAHFTIFGSCEGELLHGHNYQVEVEVEGHQLDELGLLVDFSRLKTHIRRACARLDTRTLLPDDSPHLTWRRIPSAVEVEFGKRTYRFPADDVVFIPGVNTSVELLARMFWDELAGGLRDTPVETLAVRVEENAGQSCRYEAPLSDPQP